VEQLGEILKKTRLEKGLTLEQVEKDTKIRKEFLEAMENENWDYFSEYIYLKNFLRTYCRYLELDNSEYLYFLIENLKPKSRPQKLPEKIDLTTAPCHKTKVFFAIFAILILFFTSYIYKQYITSSLNVAEVPKFDETSEQHELKFEQSEQEQSESGEQEVIQSEQIRDINMFRLSLKCIDDRCWVEVKNSEDESLYRGMMVKDEEISFNDLQKVTLKLGNAGQVQVTINDKNLGVLGKIGAVVVKTYGVENNVIKEL
jgi:transcriptional regulator with XRE-family HTH domain